MSVFKDMMGAVTGIAQTFINSPSTLITSAGTAAGGILGGLGNLTYGTLSGVGTILPGVSGIIGQVGQSPALTSGLMSLINPAAGLGGLTGLLGSTPQKKEEVDNTMLYIVGGCAIILAFVLLSKKR